VVASGQNKVSKIVDQKAEDFLDIMDANVTQSWLMARAAARQMIKQGRGGKIILMSSARGLLGHPAGYSAYCASKSAVDGITKALGCELGGNGITVNALGPTVFRSPLTEWMFADDERGKTVRAGFLTRVPKGRLGEPKISPARCCSSPPKRPTSTPAISSTPTAATRQAEHGEGAHRGHRRRPHGPRHRAGLRVAGHDVTVTDAVAQNLDTARIAIAANLRELGEDESAVARVRPCADLAEAVRDADYVVEAVSEDLTLKQKLFAEIERMCARYHPRQQHLGDPDHLDHAGARRRERALGTHWWNPPFLVPLVEVIETQWTSPQTVARTMALHEAAGKQPAHVKKDVPGFIGNRLQHALWREAISLVEQRHLRRRDRRRCHQGFVRPRLPCSARWRTPIWSAPISRSPSTISCCRRSTAGRAVALSAKARGRRQARFQIRREGFRKWSADRTGGACAAKVMQHLKSAERADA
jgi:hypothetical protein